MQLVLVCGPWGSGTTAVAGLLAEIGLSGLEPYFRTNDPLAPNSFESVAFKRLVRTAVSEEAVALYEDRPSTLHADLVAFRSRIETALGPSPVPLFLKDALAALIIEPICAVFDTRLVFVIRPLEEIEATRLRRKWHERYGAKGARVIYAAMFDALVRGAFPVLLVRYRDVLQSPAAAAEQLARFAGVTPRIDLAKVSSVRAPASGEGRG
jgi:hypothetical protein